MVDKWEEKHKGKKVNFFVRDDVYQKIPKGRVTISDYLRASLINQLKKDGLLDKDYPSNEYWTFNEQWPLLQVGKLKERGLVRPKKRR